ncbi:MAG: RdgB/HAM1 family non-canonical purine NTP pyrophosphatase [Candidatus Omnitrophica bacterium]|nr:RdgB/HAM1 family non-canonical purine NTP pyrophosphatase [Candidatus Omnitrophota bacterium]
MKELVIATKNPDKEREIKKLLKGLKVKVVSLKRYPKAPAVREGHRSFSENALRKAMAISKFTKRPALADDSGLEVDALGGRPGIRSSRYAGKDATYEDNYLKLLKALKGKKAKDRSAQFRCVVAFCDYPKILGTVEGIIRGKIAYAPVGKNGFGYDPVFTIPKYKKTFAQLSPKLKNQISHRAKALKKARALVLKYFNSSPSKT